MFNPIFRRRQHPARVAPALAYPPHWQGMARLATLTVVTGIGGCGGGGDAVAPAQPAASGTIAVSLATDAPACGFDAINLTIAKLRFHRDVTADANGPGWEELRFAPTRQVNLLHAATAANGSAIVLGELKLPAGLYTQAMLVPAAGVAPVARPAGASADVTLTTSAAFAAGGRLPIDLKVVEGQTLPLVIDADGCAALQPRGTGFVFKPRPRAVPATVNGINGYLAPGASGKLAIVTAQRSGAIYATAVPHPTTGAFTLARLDAGNYDVVVHAPGLAAAVIGKVPVSASGMTSIANATAPLATPATDSSTIEGRVTYTAPAVNAPDGTWVAVTQTIPANLAIGRTAIIVTYRLQATDADSGSYQIAGLPRGRLYYAPYQASQPLSLGPIATQLGDSHYRAESVATGYGNKTSVASNNIDASNGSVSGINIAITLP